MKTVVFTPTVIGAVGVIAGATGYSNLYAVIPRHVTLSRLIVVLFGAVALIAALGCWKRTMLGWYSGAAFIWMAILWGIFRAIYVALTFDLDWLGLVLGGVGEVVKIGVFAWLMLRFWKKLRQEFKEPNQSPEPTSGIVTSPAEPGAAPIPPVAHL